jgi:hypothetical protein
MLRASLGATSRPHYARLLVSHVLVKHIDLVSSGKALFARSSSWLLRLLMAARGCSRLLAAARGCSRLLAAARGCSRLLAAACGFSQLLAASRRLALTRPQIARPDERIAQASLRVARSSAWLGFTARGWPLCTAEAYVRAGLNL